MTSMKNKTDLILNDKRKSNDILDVLIKLEDEDDSTKTKAIQSLCKIFKSYLNDKSMYSTYKFDQDAKDNDSESIYKNWLNLRYNDAFSAICHLMFSEVSSISELSLKSIHKLLISESRNPLRSSKNIGEAFPLITFRIFVKSLMSSSKSTVDVINQFAELFAFDDAKYFTLKIIHSSIESHKEKEASTDYLNNTLALLYSITIADSDETEEYITMVECKDKKNKILQPSNQRKIYSALWLDLLKLKMNSTVYKSILLSLHDKVMPYFTSPLLLSDFLTTSYNMGGVISILALNAIFVLINKYNLNYPDFYQKLYMLLEPNVLLAKYRARFFYLCDLFLTSTHLPCYLVAAFIKRLARLSLCSSPATITILVPFIFNLINRHPNCSVLLNRTEPSEYDNDPYVREENDPSKCKALDSSLWELKTLQSHYYYTVQQEAVKIESKLVDKEIDICPMLEDNYKSLFENESTKSYKLAPMTYKVSESLFDFDDYLTI